jgi:ABC-type glutathione transport system ATPase component
MSVVAFLDRATTFRARASIGNRIGSGGGSGGGESGGADGSADAKERQQQQQQSAALVGSSPWVLERFYSVATGLGLSTELMKTSLMADLSGGELARAMLACGIALAPDVLLLDEPTGALDAASTELAEQQIKQASSRDRMIIVLVSHSPEQVGRLADTVLTISRGLN